MFPALCSDSNRRTDHAAMLDDEDKVNLWEVGLSDLSTARLIRLAEATKICPKLLLESMIHDLLEDDERHNVVPGAPEVLSPADRNMLN